MSAFEFSSGQERDKWLAGVKLETDGEYAGLPVIGTDYAKLAASIGGKLGDMTLAKSVLQMVLAGCKARDAAKAAEDADSEVGVFPNRNGDGYSVFQGPQGKRKHLVYVATGTIRRIVDMAPQLAEIRNGKSSGPSKMIDGALRWYYSAVDSYEIQRGKKKGEMSAAKPAVIVSVVPGSLVSKITHKGPQADEFATQHGLSPVNNPAQDDDAE